MTSASKLFNELKGVQPLSSTEDAWSLESCKHFLRYGVENYDRLGAAAFPDIAHLILSHGSPLGAIRQLVQNVQNCGCPERFEQLNTLRKACDQLLQEMALEPGERASSAYKLIAAIGTTLPEYKTGPGFLPGHP